MAMLSELFVLSRKVEFIDASDSWWAKSRSLIELNLVSPHDHFEAPPNLDYALHVPHYISVRVDGTPSATVWPILTLNIANSRFETANFALRIKVNKPLHA